ncbi:MAG: ATP--guanido phosphotransferase, partial [Clostridia bacterium]|nr:ATP--guanido phosphotransferase [Clostridia bacterium]
MKNDVILKSRVRIARNIKDYPFPPILNEACRKEIIEKSCSASTELGYEIIKEINDLVFAMALSEENLISREFAKEKEPHALLKKENTYIMVCEEDHLRIQSFSDGLNLKEAGENAINCERMLNDKIKFAFDNNLGYLTRCPTNLGTAMRASVMMFLPALTLSHRMADVKTQLEKIGMTIRGMYGEGSSAEAYMYQISNRLSLGQTEEEILAKTETIASRLADDERNARKILFSENTDSLTDKIMRCLGILKYAHILQSKEFLDCYAFV